MSKKSPIESAYSVGLPDRVAAWLKAHPGPHRARDVADALGVPPAVPRKDWSQRIAQILADFVRRGNAHGIVRQEVQLEGWKRPVGMYAVPADDASVEVAPR